MLVYMAATRRVTQQGRMSLNYGFYNFGRYEIKVCDGNALILGTDVYHAFSWVVIQSGAGENARLPAQKTGGLYKNNCHDLRRFCRGLSGPPSPGRRGHVRFQTGLPLFLKKWRTIEFLGV